MVRDESATTSLQTSHNSPEAAGSIWGQGGGGGGGSGAVESQGEGEVKQRKSPGSTSTGWHLCFL